jgi:hypothetical protein
MDPIEPTSSPDKTAMLVEVAVLLSRVLAYPRADRRATVVIIAGIIVAALAAVALAGGTPMRIAAVVGLIVTPVAAYLALEHPIVFPYGLYVLLMPYDVLLVVHANSTVTKTLGEAAGLVCLFYCLRVRRIAPIRQPLAVLLLLLLWMSLSVLWSVSSEETLTWLKTYFGLALLYGALALTPVSLRDFRVLLAIVVGAFSIAAIFGIHAFYHDPALRAVSDLGDQRVSLKLGDAEIDANHFANAFLFPIAVTIASFLRTRWAALKALCAIGIGLMVTAIVMSGSREALLAVGIMLAYFLWRGRDRIQLLVLSGVCALGVTPFAGMIVARFGLLFQNKQEGRASIWAVGKEALKHYWSVGSGLGTFPHVYDRFYLAVAQFRPDGWTRPPHNLILHYSVELGVVGIALIAWFVIAHFTMLRGIDRDHPLYDYRVMAEAGLVGIVTVSFFIDLFTYKYAWLVFASAAQVAYLASTFRQTRGSPQPVRAER